MCGWWMKTGLGEHFREFHDCVCVAFGSGDQHERAKTGRLRGRHAIKVGNEFHDGHMLPGCNAVCTFFKTRMQSAGLI